MNRFVMNLTAIALATLALTSCQSLNTRGVTVEADKLAQVHPKHTTKDQVLLYLGVPTFVPDYTPNKWYYISRTLRNKPWATPSLVKQSMIQITFNGEVVSAVEVFNNKDQPVIPFVIDQTDPQGTQENPVQTFVKNFGRFNKATRTKRR